MRRGQAAARVLRAPGRRRIRGARRGRSRPPARRGCWWSPTASAATCRSAPPSTARRSSATRPGLGADAATANPLLGADALEPLVAAAERGGRRGCSRSCGPRTRAPRTCSTSRRPDVPLHERIAGLVAERAGRLMGESGLSGMGAVVGATEPEHLGRLRELMPAVGLPDPGRRAPRAGAPATSGRRSGRTRPRSWSPPHARSPGAGDPGAAAEALRAELWSLTAA